MPNICSNLRGVAIKGTLGILAGSLYTIPRIVSAQLGYVLCHQTIPSYGASANAAALPGALGGMITGFLASNLLGNFTEQGESLSYHFHNITKRIFPLVPLALTLIADTIGDAITVSINPCVKFTPHTSECEVYYGTHFLSTYTQASMVGNTVLIPTVTLLGYAGYEFCKRRNPSNHQERQPSIAELERRVENEIIAAQARPVVAELVEINYQALPAAAKPVDRVNYRQQLANCYDGEVPASYQDSAFHTLMNYPVIFKCGDNFDRESLARLKAEYQSCPTCHAPFINKDFTHPTPNTYLRSKIIELVEKKERAARPAASSSSSTDENNNAVVVQMSEQLRSPANQGIFGKASMNQQLTQAQENALAPSRP